MQVLETPSLSAFDSQLSTIIECFVYLALLVSSLAVIDEYEMKGSNDVETSPKYEGNAPLDVPLDLPQSQFSSLLAIVCRTTSSSHDLQQIIRL